MAVAVAVSVALLAVMAVAFYPLPTLQQLLDSHCLQRLVKRQDNLTAQGPLAEHLVLAAVAVPLRLRLLTEIRADAHTKAALGAVLAVALVLAVPLLLVVLADLMLGQLEVVLLVALLVAAAQRVVLEPLSKWAAAAALAVILREQWLAELVVLAVAAAVVVAVVHQQVALTLALVALVAVASVVFTLGKDNHYALCNT
jgi:hypothetical protein